MNVREWFRLILVLSLVLAAVLGSYLGAIALFGFEDAVALSVHFGRVSFGIAVLILFIPALTGVFLEMPPPARDYLVIGIILSALSSVGFAFWNEAGRQFGVDTSIFTSPIAGFLSLLLVISWIFCMLAPIYGKESIVTRRTWFAAVAAGIMVGGALVFVAPLFR